jgi:hypothetical protein
VTPTNFGTPGSLDEINRLAEDAPVCSGHAPRHVLLIAYYFPPNSSSGVHRALNMVTYLPACGWLPTVLTIRPADYPPGNSFDSKLERIIPSDVRVVRAPLLRPIHMLARRIRGVRAEPPTPAEGQTPIDFTKRPFVVRAFRRAMDVVTGFPDDKAPWLLPALWLGWRASRRQDFDAVLVTGGPWTSFVIGYVLKMALRIPLILDYRDPWTQNVYRRKAGLRFALEATLERRIVRSAAGIVLNTDEMRQTFVNHHPSIAVDRVITVTNGFNRAADRRPP